MSNNKPVVKNTDTSNDPAPAVVVVGDVNAATGDTAAVDTNAAVTAIAAIDAGAGSSNDVDPATLNEAPPVAPAPVIDAAVVLNAPVAIEVKKEPAPVINPQLKKEFVSSTTMRAGTVVTTTAAVAIEQTPEFKLAMEVGKPQTQSALHQLVKYCVDMAPGQPQTEKTVIQNQLNLLNILFTIMTAEDKNFADVWRAVISVVNENKTKAFKVTMRNRGLNSVSLEVMDNKQMRFLTRIVDLLCVNAGIVNIDLVKTHVNIGRVLEAVYNVRIRQNLTAFYSV